MMKIEVWLYGPLARYAGEQSQGSYANLNVEMAEGCTIGDLVRQLGIPSDERGITFLNGNLARLPGLEVDLEVELHDGDRVGISHGQSMWPFQYRFGAHLTPQLQDAFRERQDRGVHHAYSEPSGKPPTD